MQEEEQKPKDSGTWKENLGKYLIDISKYVVTGVIIASTFNDMYDDATCFTSLVLSLHL
jgi:hypothetical protein